MKAFKAHLLAVDPKYSGVVDDIPIVDLDQALKDADIIILHLSGENVLLGNREFGIMKQGVYVLNAARGELIDEDDLVKALNTGRVAGAWLDTFSVEPYKGSLCGYDQVILTPHIGSYTKECRLSMEMEAVGNLLKGLGP